MLETTRFRDGMVKLFAGATSLRQASHKVHHAQVKVLLQDVAGVVGSINLFGQQRVVEVHQILFF